MSKRLVSFVLAVFFVAGFITCSKDSSPTAPKEQKEAPTLAAQQVTVPPQMAQSTDPHAQLAVGFISMANSFSAFGSNFAPPALQKTMFAASPDDDPTWFQTWTNAGLTISVSIYDKGDMYVWDIRFSGTDGEDTFDNWLFIHAEQSQERNSGTMTIYEPVTTKVSSVFTWGMDADNVYTLTMVSIFEGAAEKVVVQQRPDKSGSLEASEGTLDNFVLQFACQWTAEGSGTWTSYDNGTEIDSGSWK